MKKKQKNRFPYQWECLCACTYVVVCRLNKTDKQDFKSKLSQKVLNFLDSKKAGVFERPKWNHFSIVSTFFIFKFLLPTVDMTTDLMTAKEFFDNGHTNWGICTTLPIFAPFIVRVILAGVRVGQCYKITMEYPMSFTVKKNESSYKIQMQELPNLIWDFPAFQPFRYQINLTIICAKSKYHTDSILTYFCSGVN